MNKWIFVFWMLGALTLGASPAHARCSKSAEMKFSDGAVGCVEKVGTTRISRSQLPYNIRHSFDGGLVVIKMQSGTFSGAARTRVLSKRGRDACLRFRMEILGKIAKPKHPFMVVVMKWNPNDPDRHKRRSRDSVYLSKNCRAKRIQ